MSIQIVSDLHLEAPRGYDEFDIEPKAPILALLGDIGNVAIHKHEMFAFLRRQLERFCTVLFVAGNHEAYGSTWPKTLGQLRAFENDVNSDPAVGKFHLLKRGTYEIPDTNVVILGCSLFSHIPAASRDAVSMGLNDFFQIQDWDTEKHNEAHERDLSWLNSEVSKREGQDIKIIILTHWSPTIDGRSVDPKNVSSLITSGFATDLSGQPCFRSSKVKIWAFGHTHYNCDFELEREDGVGSLRLVTNQRGYYFSQAEGYDGEKLIEG